MKVKRLMGIIDWGIGGVSIYKLIKQQLGKVPIVYFSDTGTTPYGKMTRRELVARLSTVIEFMQSRGVTHLVIGCNAASTAIPYLKTESIKIEGVIERAVDATLKLRPKRLGLIGGRRTMLSGVYRKAFASHGIKVKQRIAQPLSGLIESGDVSSDRLRSKCERILSPMRNCSHILLACTHYPAIAGVISEFVSAKTILIDPAESVVKSIKSWEIDGNGQDEFLTTGDAKLMKLAAERAFGVNLPSVRRVQV
ncbi:MAG: glutamate racemase [Blastocatellia bacterium]